MSQNDGIMGKGTAHKAAAAGTRLLDKSKCLKCKILAFDLLRGVPETANSSLPLLSLFLIPEALQDLDNFRGSSDKCMIHTPDSSQGMDRTL